MPLAAVPSLPVVGWVAIGAIVVIELGLDVIALVSLYRRPVHQVLFANKWIWVAIIVLVSLVGPILYLAAGRKPAVSDETPPPSSGAPDHIDSVADSLYGRREDDAVP